MTLTAWVGAAVLTTSATGTQFLAGQATTHRTATVNATSMVSAMALQQECELPEGTRWCSVKQPGPGFVHWDIAAYADGDIVSNSICATGNFELGNVKSFGKPGRALDIGANIGYFAFALAFEGWEVHAFEPMDRNVKLMRATACRNPKMAERVHIHHMGLGATSGECEIMSGVSNKGDGVTRCGNNTGAAPAGFVVRQRFDVRRLDDILGQLSLPSIEMVKLDVEGFEWKVLEGGESLFTKYQPRLIRTEVWPKMQGCKPKEYLQKWEEEGYTIARDVHCGYPTKFLDGVSIFDFYMCKKKHTTAA